MTSIFTYTVKSDYQKSDSFINVMYSIIQNEFAGEFEYIQWQLPEKVSTIGGLTADIVYGAVQEVIRNTGIQDGVPLCITIRDDGVGPNVNHNSTGGSGGGLAFHGTPIVLM